MARPPKPEGEALDRLLQIRIKGVEQETYRKAAEARGLDLSAWVRERLNAAAKRDLRRSADA